MLSLQASRPKPRRGRLGAAFGGSVRRVQGIVILLAALGATQAQASSIEPLQPLTGAASSIVVLGEDVSIDPSIVAATPREVGPFPSVVAVADTPDTPSIVTLGEPAPANEDVAAASQRPTTPMV